MTELVIDKEFAEIFPPLSERKFELLEESILSEGCREDLVIWNGIIIDGHNRYKICQKHNIPFKCREISFPDREHAKLWKIKEQIARRNLTVFQRCMLIIPMEEDFKKEAEERRRARISEYRKSGETVQISVPSKKTQDILADLAGTSHDTIEKVKYILKNADDELKEQLARGDIKVNRIFNELKGKKAEEALSDISEFVDEDIKDIDDIDDSDEQDFEAISDEKLAEIKRRAAEKMAWIHNRADNTIRDTMPEPPIESIGGFKPLVHTSEEFEQFEQFPHEPERNPGPFYYVKSKTKSAMKQMLREVKAAIYQLSDDDVDKCDEILAIIDEACQQAKNLINQEKLFHKK